LRVQQPGRGVDALEVPGVQARERAPARRVAILKLRSVGGRSGAPRGALLYPRCSREELGGRFLGLMAYLDPKE
jgi:hypothetical protein